MLWRMERLFGAMCGTQARERHTVDVDWPTCSGRVGFIPRLTGGVTFFRLARKRIDEISPLASPNRSACCSMYNIHACRCLMTHRRRIMKDECVRVLSHAVIRGSLFSQPPHTAASGFDTHKGRWDGVCVECITACYFLHRSSIDAA